MAVDTSRVAQLDVEPGKLPATMAAWVIREERFGEPVDAFQLEEMPVPEPGPFEVIVRVMAAGVNFNNVWAALGKPVSVFRYREEDHHIGGSDASGIVWKVGHGVTRWKPGDEVVIHCNQASYEDYEVHGLDPPDQHFHPLTEFRCAAQTIRHALLQAMGPHLPFVPIDERWIDGHKSDPSPHAERREKIGLAQTDNRHVDRAANFQEAGLLEMPDDKCVISGAFCFQRVADGLGGTPEFRQRMKMLVGWIETVDLEFEIGAGNRVDQALQPLDVGRLLDRVDEALVPHAGGTGRFSHVRAFGWWDAVAGASSDNACCGR